MELSSTIQSLLERLKQYLKTLYGERLYQVFLFGSYARGEARSDSDIDVLIVLSGSVNPGKEVVEISDFLTELSLEYEKVLSCLFMGESDFIAKQGPLLRNIRREGIAV